MPPPANTPSEYVDDDSVESLALSTLRMHIESVPITEPDQRFQPVSPLVFRVSASEDNRNEVASPNPPTTQAYPLRWYNESSTASMREPASIINMQSPLSYVRDHNLEVNSSSGRGPRIRPSFYNLRSNVHPIAANQQVRLNQDIPSDNRSRSRSQPESYHMESSFTVSTIGDPLFSGSNTNNWEASADLQAQTDEDDLLNTRDRFRNALESSREMLNSIISANNNATLNIQSLPPSLETNNNITTQMLMNLPDLPPENRQSSPLQLPEPHPRFPSRLDNVQLEDDDLDTMLSRIDDIQDEILSTMRTMYTNNTEAPRSLLERLYEIQLQIMRTMRLITSTNNPLASRSTDSQVEWIPSITDNSDFQDTSGITSIQPVLQRYMQTRLRLGEPLVSRVLSRLLVTVSEVIDDVASFRDGSSDNEAESDDDMTLLDIYSRLRESGIINDQNREFLDMVNDVVDSVWGNEIFESASETESAGSLAPGLYVLESTTPLNPTITDDQRNEMGTDNNPLTSENRIRLSLIDFTTQEATHESESSSDETSRTEPYHFESRIIVDNWERPPIQDQEYIPVRGSTSIPIRIPTSMTRIDSTSLNSAQNIQPRNEPTETGFVWFEDDDIPEEEEDRWVIAEEEADQFEVEEGVSESRETNENYQRLSANDEATTRLLGLIPTTTTSLEPLLSNLTTLDSSPVQESSGALWARFRAAADPNSTSSNTTLPTSNTISLSQRFIPDTEQETDQLPTEGLTTSEERPSNTANQFNFQTTPFPTSHDSAENNTSPPILIDPLWNQNSNNSNIESVDSQLLQPPSQPVFSYSSSFVSSSSPSPLLSEPYQAPYLAPRLANRRIPISIQRDNRLNVHPQINSQPTTQPYQQPSEMMQRRARRRFLNQRGQRLVGVQPQTLRRGVDSLDAPRQNQAPNIASSSTATTATIATTSTAPSIPHQSVTYGGNDQPRPNEANISDTPAYARENHLGSEPHDTTRLRDLLDGNFTLRESSEINRRDVNVHEVHSAPQREHNNVTAASAVNEVESGSDSSDDDDSDDDDAFFSDLHLGDDIGAYRNVFGIDHDPFGLNRAENDVVTELAGHLTNRQVDSDSSLQTFAEIDKTNSNTPEHLLYTESQPFSKSERRWARAEFRSILSNHYLDWSIDPPKNSLRTGATLQNCLLFRTAGDNDVSDCVWIRNGMKFSIPRSEPEIRNQSGYSSQRMPNFGNSPKSKSSPSLTSGNQRRSQPFISSNNSDPQPFIKIIDNNGSQYFALIRGQIFIGTKIIPLNSRALGLGGRFWIMWKPAVIGENTQNSDGEDIRRFGSMGPMQSSLSPLIGQITWYRQHGAVARANPYGFTLRRPGSHRSDTSTPLTIPALTGYDTVQAFVPHALDAIQHHLNNMIARMRSRRLRSQAVLEMRERHSRPATSSTASYTPIQVVAGSGDYNSNYNSNNSYYFGQAPGIQSLQTQTADDQYATIRGAQNQSRDLSNRQSFGNTLARPLDFNDDSGQADNEEEESRASDFSTHSQVEFHRVAQQSSTFQPAAPQVSARNTSLAMDIGETDIGNADDEDEDQESIPQTEHQLREPLPTDQTDVDEYAEPRARSPDTEGPAFDGEERLVLQLPLLANEFHRLPDFSRSVPPRRRRLQATNPQHPTSLRPYINFRNYISTSEILYEPIVAPADNLTSQPQSTSSAANPNNANRLYVEQEQETSVYDLGYAVFGSASSNTFITGVRHRDGDMVLAESFFQCFKVGQALGMDPGRTLANMDVSLGLDENSRRRAKAILSNTGRTPRSDIEWLLQTGLAAPVMTGTVAQLKPEEEGWRGIFPTFQAM